LRNKAALPAEEKGMMDEFNLCRLIEKISPELMRKAKGYDKDICVNVEN
jgi:citrate synthase